MFLNPSPKFHNRTGSLVVLSNGNRTAQRTHASQEFNNGLVFSAEPLADNQLFQVKIDKKISAWSGSIEIGLTSINPATMNFPTSATGFTSGTWIVSGNAVMKDGRTLLDSYGWDLDRAMEEDRVGVLKTADGVMHVYFNGEDQGAAAMNLPSKVWAVFDMYGKCAQVSIVDDRRNVEELISNSMSASFIDAMLTATMVDSAVISLASSVRDVINSTTLLLRRDTTDPQVQGSNLGSRSDPGDCDSASVHERITSSSSRSTLDTFSSREGGASLNIPTNRLTFHERHGTLIKLSPDRSTCERMKPLDEFNNGVVMTNRALKDDELFEIRLDRLVDKWSGSIEVGVTTHNPNTLEFPATMTNMRSGTIMMSGNGILTNGKGTRRQYGSFNLDELEEGNTIGLVRKSSGTLHYFINSIDQGVAATKVPEVVWGVVDLYGMAVKVTVINHPPIADGPHNPNEVRPPTIGINGTLSGNFTDSLVNFIPRDPLLFNTRCGHHCQVVANQKTALRPNAMEDFNNAVVLTQRYLEPEEMFEVRIDRMVEKWAGSIEIGVTTHSPADFEFPSTMTNVRSGTWMMTGNGIMHNGVTILENYGHNLDKLKAGDRVGALRKIDGCLHFYVNGFDQGLAASDVPPNVFGVVDLYGQAAMATIINPSELANLPESSSYANLYSGLYFQPCPAHQDNSFSSDLAVISEDSKTVCRLQERRGRRHDAVVISSRPLGTNELFEVVLVQTANGGERSIEAGVKWFGRMDGRSHDQLVWILSGSTVMQGEETVKVNYALDLDAIKARSKVGLMARADGSLHYFLNGLDKGPACSGIPKGVYGVISLVGRGTQLAVVDPMMSSGSHDSSSDQVSNQEDMSTSVIYNDAFVQQFSSHHLRNVDLSDNNSRASRSADRSSAWVCSGKPLKINEPFEIQVESTSGVFSGGFRIGLTSSPLPDLLLSDLELQNRFRLTLATSDLYVRDELVQECFCSDLDGLSEGDKIGLGVGLGEHGEREFHLFINGSHVAAHVLNCVLKAFYVELHLNGKVHDVSICPPGSVVIPQVNQCTSTPMMMMSLQVVQQDREDESENVSSCRSSAAAEAPQKDDPDHFWGCCAGENVELTEKGGLKRMNGFNHGVVVLERSLGVNEVLKVKVEELEDKWSSSLKVGFLVQHCSNKLDTSRDFKLPKSSLDFKVGSCIFSSNFLFVNGFKVPCIPSNLWNMDDLVVGDVLSLSRDLKGHVHLGLNGEELAVIDLCAHLNAIQSGRHFCMEENKDLQLLVHQYPGRKRSQVFFPVVDLYGKAKCVKVAISALSCKNEVSAAGQQLLALPQASDEREKADSENESKEKSSAEENVSPRVVDTNDCKFFQLCTEVKNSLSLPEGFFHDENLRCYCESCHKLNREGLYFRKGEPPRDYATPVGWASFPLRQQYRNESSDVWHTAYHGVDVGRVRRILDSGDIVLPSNQFFGGRGSMMGNFSEEKSGPEDMQDVRPVILSPTIKYASLIHFSPKLKYIDEKTRKAYWAQLSFQVSLKPGSYKVNSQTVGLEGHLDSRFANSELEWLTKEQKAVVLNSLLIRVEVNQ